MKLKHQSLLYDIENMAFVIADTVEKDRHALHCVRDICREGNIDRVSRMLGLAYSKIMAVLSPVILSPGMSLEHDFSLHPHDYAINFKTTRAFRYVLTPEIKLKIKETAREYMVCMVLADWLGVTLPEAADVWKYRADLALEALAHTVSNLSFSLNAGFRRRLSPF